MKKFLAAIVTALLIGMAITGCSRQPVVSPTPVETARPTETPAPSSEPAPAATPQQTGASPAPARTAEQTATPEPSTEPTSEATPGQEIWDGNSALFYVRIYRENSAMKCDGMLIGEINDYRIGGLDAGKIYINGRRLNGEIRGALEYDGAGRPKYTTETAYAELGQIFQLYDAETGKHTGSCQLTAMEYAYSAASGEDYLSCEFLCTDPIWEGNFYAIKGTVNMRPRVVETDVSEGHGRGVTLTADIDSDGTAEKIVWDSAAMAMDEEGVLHPVNVMRGEKTLCTVSYFYDFDYTSPNDPVLLDINGDGGYELILSAYGHNAYIHILDWKDSQYKATGAGYYAGD